MCNHILQWDANANMKEIEVRFTKKGKKACERYPQIF